MENLVKIQNELKVPKGNFNSFGKYKYRSAEDILEAVKPLLIKYDSLLTLSDTIVLVGTKLFLCAEAEFSHKDKTKLVHGYAELSEHKGMSAEQTTGTASSYSRKYALNGLFLIDETESDADSDSLKQQKKAPQLTEAQFNACIKGIKEGKKVEVIKYLAPFDIPKDYEIAIDAAIASN